MAAEMVKESHIPLLTLENWIDQAPTLSTEHSNLMTTNELKSKPMKVKAYIPAVSIVNGRLVCDDALINGGKVDVQWWNGKLKPNYIDSYLTRVHVTRFVPGREGFGLTDRVDSVVSSMQKNGIVILDHNYGLWTDRRRDDHERIRRRDGDVWAPFMNNLLAVVVKELPGMVYLNTT